MIRLFVIADDFTGALDTGVQFASYGAVTKVVVDVNLRRLQLPADVQVLVVDAETRHLSAENAYRTVKELVGWAVENGVGCIYKKTDSALRGNLGAELSAVLETGGGRRLHFVPAFPDLHRVTRGGVHYIDGVSVADSVFGRDPFEPVQSSCVAELLARQTDVPVYSVPSGGKAADAAGILVYDACTNRDMATIADSLARRGETALLAGCAGFASVLPRLLRLDCTAETPVPLCDKLLVACGSINPVSVRQCDVAQAAGAPRFVLTPAQKLDRNWAGGEEAGTLVRRLLDACGKWSMVVLDAGSQAVQGDTPAQQEQGRVCTMHTVGVLLKRMLDAGLDSTIFIMGGDSLQGLMHQLDVGVLTPLCEPEPGVVLSQFCYRGRVRNLISKSGGFGAPELFLQLQEKLTHWKDELTRPAARRA